MIPPPAGGSRRGATSNIGSCQPNRSPGAMIRALVSRPRAATHIGYVSFIQWSCPGCWCRLPIADYPRGCRSSADVATMPGSCDSPRLTTRRRTGRDGGRQRSDRFPRSTAAGLKGPVRGRHRQRTGVDSEQVPSELDQHPEDDAQPPQRQRERHLDRHLHVGVSRGA